MRLFFNRYIDHATKAPADRKRGDPPTPVEVVSVDLARLFADSAAGPLLPAGTPIEPDFGPRGMGAGPTGVAKMDLTTGEVSPSSRSHSRSATSSPTLG